MNRNLFILIILMLPVNVWAQGEITGKWKTIDDETGEAKSIVEIYEQNGKYYGKIVKLFRSPDQDPDPVCDECPKEDPRFGKKIIGMEIIKDLKKDGDEYTDGTVLKPDEGKIYECKIWLNKTQLKIRGYWGFFYRTQSWKRAD